MKAVIIDIDGTLANAKHRLHHIENGKKDWKSFFAEAPNDRLNFWCAELLMAHFHQGHKIIFLTGRGEEDRAMTLDWLHRNIPLKHEAGDFRLMMRPAKDRRHDYVVKAEIYDSEIKPIYDVLYVVEDRGSVVKMWRGIGVPCLQCDDWEERSGESTQKEIAEFFLKRNEELATAEFQKSLKELPVGPSIG